MADEKTDRGLETVDLVPLVFGPRHRRLTTRRCWNDGGSWDPERRVEPAGWSCLASYTPCVCAPRGKSALYG
jgi:hypothetical protein